MKAAINVLYFLAIVVWPVYLGQLFTLSRDSYNLPNPLTTAIALPTIFTLMLWVGVTAKLWLGGR